MKIQSLLLKLLTIATLFPASSFAQGGLFDCQLAGTPNPDRHCIVYAISEIDSLGKTIPKSVYATDQKGYYSKKEGKFSLNNLWYQASHFDSSYYEKLNITLESDKVIDAETYTVSGTTEFYQSVNGAAATKVGSETCTGDAWPDFPISTLQSYSQITSESGIGSSGGVTLYCGTKIYRVLFMGHNVIDMSGTNADAALYYILANPNLQFLQTKNDELVTRDLLIRENEKSILTLTKEKDELLTQKSAQDKQIKKLKKLLRKFQ